MTGYASNTAIVGHDINRNLHSGRKKNMQTMWSGLAWLGNVQVAAFIPFLNYQSLQDYKNNSMHTMLMKYQACVC